MVGESDGGGVAAGCRPDDRQKDHRGKAGLGIEDLLTVKGIGAKRLEEIRSLVGAR